MEFSETVRQRQSVKRYETGVPISDQELALLFEETILSPSSFNMQHWRFVAVRDHETKVKLREAAWNQEQLETCSAVIAVCAKLDAHKDARQIYASEPEAVQARLVPMITEFYGRDAQLQRDEAIRSAALASMTFMLSAKNRGWDTCPMIGFDVNAVNGILGLPPNCPPVMIIVLGKALGESRPRASRLPLSHVVHLEQFDGPALKS